MRRQTLLLLLLLVAAPALRAQSNTSNARAGIDALNRKLEDATRRMDNDATIALWSDDGVSLLPGTPPIRGKAAIRAFVDGVTRSMPAAHMKSFEMHCFDIISSGDWGSEWCTEHQVVDFGAARAPFDGWGKMLFVLHRAADGEWRIQTEMWNQALPDSTGTH